MLAAAVGLMTFTVTDFLKSGNKKSVTKLSLHLIAFLFFDRQVLLKQVCQFI